MTETILAPAVADTATPTTTRTDAQDWTTSLAPELKTLVTSKGYKTPADVVQAYSHAQRALGADKIPAPKDGVWDPIALEKMGVPKDPTGYQLKRPEMPEGLTYDENFEKAALPVLHKMGIPPAAAQQLLDLYAGQAVQQHQALSAAREAQGAEALGALKTEWGQAFDQNVGAAARAAKHFGGQELVDALNSSGAGNDPHLIRAFAKIGKMMGEDPLKTGRTQGSMLTPAEARVEANKLMKSDAYLTNKDPIAHKAAVEQVQLLMQQAHPEPAQN